MEYRIIYKNELRHHGIKGQKWGIRRFQNDDGSYTSAGRQRYGIGFIGDRFKQRNKTIEKRPGLFSRHKNNLIEKYMTEGYSPEAAQAKAERRIRTEAILAAIGAVTITAVGVKAYRRIGQDYFDKTFKQGMAIQNVGRYENATFKDSPFFAAVNNNDKKAYGAMYPNEKRAMMKQLGGNKYQGIYNNQITLDKDVKRASVNTAQKIFYQKMDSDPEYRKKVIDTLKQTNYNDTAAIQKYVNNGKKTRKLYDRFNQALATPQFQSKNLHNEYYDELKKKGYNAILDINDTRYSGYKKISKDPTIFFGDDWHKSNSRKLSEKEIDTNMSNYVLNMLGKNMAKQAAVAYGRSKSLDVIDEQIIINDYLKKHPKSKLSRKEILDNYASQ